MQCIDYNLDSDDEWNELHCDNLEDDELLLEDGDQSLNGDDPDLRNEGFIVADDYVSDNSIEADDADDNTNAKEMLRKTMEKQNRKLMENVQLIPYIHTRENANISEFKCIAFRRK